MKNLYISVIVLIPWLSGYTQDYLGFVNSNYAGNYGTLYQPASIVDNRYAWELNLLGMDATVENNFLGLYSKNFFNNFNTGLRGGEVGLIDDNVDFVDDYLFQLNKSADKNLYTTFNVLGPSLMINIKNKHSIGFSTRGRSFIGITNISDNIADNLFLSIQSGSIDTLIGTTFDGDGVTLQAMAWREYGLTYGTVLKNSGDHFIKAAATLKFIRGAAGGYFKMDNFNFEFPSDTSLDFASADIAYAYSENIEAVIDSGDFSGINPLGGNGLSSFGFDLGVVYEHRPNYKRFFYFMDNDSNNIYHDQNKYRYKVGVSLLDIGSVKYNAGPSSYDFSVGSEQVILSALENEEPFDYDSFVVNNFGATSAGSTFEMTLPTALSIQFDYHVGKGPLYIGSSILYGFKPKNYGARQLSRITIAPRWERSMLEAALPISYDANGVLKVGAQLRMVYFTLGTNNIFGTLLRADEVSSANVYFGVKIPWHKKPLRDVDEDFVSNRKDKCRKVPGVWERLGCPEPEIEVIEEDTIMADTDEDGIIDEEDDCPTKFGPVVFNGCPDTDNDSVPDVRDSCIDVPGLVELFGCPEEPAINDTPVVASSERVANKEVSENEIIQEVVTESKEILDEEEPVKQLPEDTPIQQKEKRDCFEGMSDQEAYQQAIKKYGKVKIPGLIYKVQIGAYKKPPEKGYFDFLTSVGNIENITTNGITRFTAGASDNIENIEVLRQNIKIQGIQDAFIAPVYNGEKVTMRKAIEIICNK